MKRNSLRGIVLGLVVTLLGVAPLLAQEPAQEPAPTTPEIEYGPPVSPRGAFLRSLVLPGWGQAYVGATGRGAVYFTMASGSVWMSYVARRQLHDARAQQEWLRTAPLPDPDPDPGADLPLDQDSEFVQARARHFEDWVALSVFLFFFAGADAYVSAYLADFDERIGVRPGADGALRFEARLPVGGPR